MHRDTLLFDASLLVFTPIEYVGLYLLVAHVFTDGSHTAAIIVTAFFAVLGILVLVLNRIGSIPEKHTDEQAKKRYLKTYGEDLRRIGELRGKPIRLAVVDVRHILPADAFYHQGTVYINKKTHINPHFFRAILYHELGHAMSRVSDHAHGLALRPFYLLGKYTAMGARLMITHTRKAPRFLKTVIRILGHTVALAANVWPMLTVYPFFRHEEHRANRFAVRQGQGEALRTFYRTKGHPRKKALFDFEHPTRKAMIAAIDEQMGKTAPIDQDIFLLGDRIHYVDHADTAADKQKKIVRWLLLHADERPAWARELGRHHEFGIGVERDPDRAMVFYTQAAEKNDAESHFRLAVLRRDDDEAHLHHLECAAADGHAKACVRLAEHLIAGRIVARDTDRARDLLETAQGKRDPVARRTLRLTGHTYHLSSVVDGSHRRRPEDPGSHTWVFKEDFRCIEATPEGSHTYMFIVDNRRIKLLNDAGEVVRTLRMRAGQIRMTQTDPTPDDPDRTIRLVFTRTP